MTGNSMYHEELESEMACLHKKQAALIFTSGFVANEVSISTLARALPGSQGSLVLLIYYRFRMFLYTHNFKLNVQRIRLPTSRK